MVEERRGFSIIIVVSSSRDQADFWQERLEAARGSVIGRETKVISVHEDWPNGAGQLLGTLYAWEQSRARVNVDDVLCRGGTVAMYHTAGKGMRMAPLPAAEANNKSAIKLPRLIEIGGRRTPLTVLEAVIFQTGIFAASRPGRLCVFWGDQVFIPSRSVDFEGRHHAEIFDIRSPIPETKEAWERDWQSYGLIIPDGNGGVLQREKQSWDALQELIRRGVARPDSSGRIVLGKSLGCFSISYELLASLLEESAGELGRKQLKLDTDPHLWMPLTSGMEEFARAGGDVSNWKRVSRFKSRFLSRARTHADLFGDKDMGSDTLWWDYGQLRLYHHNFLRLLEESLEGECLRAFYGLKDQWVKHLNEEGLMVENSVILGGRLRGRVSHSVVIDTETDDVEVKDSVIITSALGGVKAQQALIYDCIDLGRLELGAGEAVADVFLPGHGKVRVRTDMGRDGKKEWQSVVPGNWYSFERYSKLAGDQPIARHAAERARWLAHYENRRSVREGVSVLCRGFIKPDPDNLVEVVWGGDLIEKLKGLEPSGRRIGESWECSTHPDHPSMVRLGNGVRMLLLDIVNLEGERILGERVYRDFKGRLPVLVKFLDAREDLSVQVHPSDERAAELGEHDTGKTESWLILGAEPGAVIYLGFKEDTDPAELERALSLPEVNIAERFLNAFPVRAGDVLFTPAGAVHAIGRGVFLVEIQQSSGITYRVWDWNRVPKRPLHIPQAIASLNFRKTSRADYVRVPQRLSEWEDRLVESAYFAVDRIRMEGGRDLWMRTNNGFQVLTCLEGAVELRVGEVGVGVGRGESVLVPASLEGYSLTALQDAGLIKSFVP